MWHFTVPVYHLLLLVKGLRHYLLLELLTVHCLGLEVVSIGISWCDLHVYVGPCRFTTLTCTLHVYEAYLHRIYVSQCLTGPYIVCSCKYI
jgi:hypothetical protein